MSAEMQSAGVRILYEDSGILAVEKQPGIMAQAGRDPDGTDLLSRLSAERTAAGEGSYLTPVHRLDFGVGGVILFAKNRFSARDLSAAVRDGITEKEYLCIVWGCPVEKEAEWTDCLFHDAGQNKTFLVKGQRKGAKEARLFYRVLGTAEADGNPVSLLRIRLLTGRTHQIRAQLSGHGYPVLCDGEYGGHRPASLRTGGIALWSFRFSFPVVRGKQTVREEVVSIPEGGVWDLFPECLSGLPEAASRPS